MNYVYLYVYYIYIYIQLTCCFFWRGAVARRTTTKTLYKQTYVEMVERHDFWGEPMGGDHALQCLTAPSHVFCSERVTTVQLTLQ